MTLTTTPRTQPYYYIVPRGSYLEQVEEDPGEPAMKNGN